MALIQVRDLVKKFGDQTVLSNINLDLQEGDVRVLMGASGSGKSTLLRCLNRLVEPTSGSIVFRGKEVLGPGVDVKELRKQIGFVFQQFALYSHLNVLDNVALGLRKLQGMSKLEAKERALHELSHFDMTSHQDKYPAQLSGGQKQRVAIARALAMDPAVLVLDEPTSALDPVMSRDVADLINHLHGEGITMICVTHDLNLASNIADTVMFLDRGVIRADDRIEVLSQHPDPEIQSFFGNKEKA
ncbi:amino acid ABC transporter ATP-binding protein [Polynucleobacter sp. es-EL-1]|jgi:polar amino acid transport system ATP-binding protein|uniref:amino acid ABC transporter ATP-binding protein n=1 Tax=Polynucleobacter sp. es-EL-1 TaxID=1855652 RepID=UPI000BDC9883|nr:amino acid ABC transporter ATP-binding protein [Polynucleobacter sp. es-EL-1]OZA41345.1 MAG: amino acid ABC transporter ATP-binding protein [Polynucleobacter sp. 17-46-58]HQR83339.1 amino acid ABC transporter ATP-binding protein [Polynucleobacter sp.]QWE11238.1 amino acid ABC transporter ATP-binding protein [Polynucleobacter sp. es-EL-1]HQS60168.1 amino acid ABC transporter ATP-binding protein [Polynucleobacter sp.]HQT20386.1 amino acid ABC transporter ATP-binding protein [Polynucleobacter 